MNISLVVDAAMTGVFAGLCVGTPLSIIILLVLWNRDKSQCARQQGRE